MKHSSPPNNIRQAISRAINVTPNSRAEPSKGRTGRQVLPPMEDDQFGTAALRTVFDFARRQAAARPLFPARRCGLDYLNVRENSSE